MDYSVKDFYVPTITYFTSGNKLTGSLCAPPFRCAAFPPVLAR